jgi:predicted DNA-binding transcriptional regulator AlpA
MELCYSIPEFCQQFRIGKTFLYKLLKDGRGPRIIRVGRRTIISSEAARDWIAQLEKAAPKSCDE